MKKAKSSNWLHAGVWRVSRLHFIYAIVLIAQTVIYDAWKLITPDAVLRRWYVTAGLLFVTTVVWYIARNKVQSANVCKLLVAALVLTDIAVASFNVYTQRGMASRAIMLYAIPLIVSAVLMSRSALFATAALSVVAYTTTAVAYFVLNFNEGYKIELYGEVGFYSVMLFLLASMLWIVVRAKRGDRHSS
jgi:hypothetical protein